MLQSVERNLESLKALAEEFGDKKLQRLLLDINDELLVNIIELLKSFDTATRMVSADRTASLHLVIPTLVTLKKHLLSNPMDSQVIIHMKVRLTRMLMQQYHIKQLHQVAMVLDPRLKTKLLSEEEKEETLMALKSMMTDVPLPSSHNDDTSEEASAPPAKKLKQSTEDSFFGELFSATSAEDNQDEVEAYLATSETSDEILRFWQSKSCIWPTLSQCAKWVLSIPATSTSSERTFSMAGRTLDDRRTQLNPETVDELLFLHGLDL